MKKIILLPLIFICALSFGQFTKNQLYTGINQNVRLKTASQTRLAAILDSIVVSMPNEFSLSNGSGTTANGMSTDWGGTVNTDTYVDIDDSVNEVFIGSLNNGVGLYLTPLSTSILSNDFTFTIDSDGNLIATDNRVTKRGIEYGSTGYETHDLALTSRGYVNSASATLTNKTIGSGSIWNGDAIGTTYGGVPGGGSTNQILTKNSGTGYDYSWVSPDFGTVELVGLEMPSGFIVSNSPVTTSGTLSVTTTLNGIIKGNGSGFSACASGTAVLVAGTVTVNESSVSTGNIIILTHQNASGVLGILSIGTITDGVSFVINSTSLTDTSTIGYLIIN